MVQFLFNFCNDLVNRNLCIVVNENIEHLFRIFFSVQNGTKIINMV